DEGPIAGTRARASAAEETAKNGCLDHRKVHKIRLLPPVFPLHLTAKNRALPESQRHRHRVREAPETRTHIGSSREASEANVQSHGRCVDEMTGLLPLSREASRVDSGNTPPGEQPDRMLDVHRNANRPGEIIRGTEGNDAQHDRRPNNGVGDRADGSVAAGRSEERRVGKDWRST